MDTLRGFLDRQPALGGSARDTAAKIAEEMSLLFHSVALAAIDVDRGIAALKLRADQLSAAERAALRTAFNAWLDFHQTKIMTGVLP